MQVSVELTELHSRVLVHLIDTMSYDMVRRCAASDQMCYDIIIALGRLRAAIEERRLAHGAPLANPGLLSRWEECGIASRMRGRIDRESHVSSLDAALSSQQGEIDSKQLESSRGVPPPSL